LYLVKRNFHMMWVDGKFNVTERTPRGVLRCSQNRPDLLPRTSSAMIGKMFRTTIGVTALLAAFFLVGCGTSSTEPEGGSLRQADTGVSSSGYPAGEPKDAGSPALASSTESHYSRDQTEKDAPSNK
jgi:hypothetical protein